MCQGKHTVLTHAMLLLLWTRIKKFWKFSGTRGELCISLYNTAMLLSKNPATAEKESKRTKRQIERKNGVYRRDRGESINTERPRPGGGRRRRQMKTRCDGWVWWVMDGGPHGGPHSSCVVHPEGKRKEKMRCIPFHCGINNSRCTLCVCSLLSNTLKTEENRWK